MCNAHNHSKYCKCGWGKGQNISRGKRYITNNSLISNPLPINYAEEVLKIYPLKEFSTTIPNALCPVCGALVFFYQNECGSRVFFDSLGIPWPKHPCTDNPQYTIKNGIEKYGNSSEIFFIPKRNENVITNSQIYFTNIEDFSVIDRKVYCMIIGVKGKFLLLDNFQFIPDIIISFKKGGKYYLQTYEIDTESYQEIPLKRHIYSRYWSYGRPVQSFEELMELLK